MICTSIPIWFFSQHVNRTIKSRLTITLEHIAIQIKYVVYLIIPSCLVRVNSYPLCFVSIG